MYTLVRKVFFLMDAERAHYLSMNALRFFCGIPPIKSAIRAVFSPNGQSLKCEQFGLFQPYFTNGFCHANLPDAYYKPVTAIAAMPFIDTA